MQVQAFEARQIPGRIEKEHRILKGHVIAGQTEFAQAGQGPRTPQGQKAGRFEVIGGEIEAAQAR